MALVTGAGRPHGIGRATALRFAEQGASVVVTDLCKKNEGGLAFLGVGDDFTQLERVVGEIEERGAAGLAVSMDVTDRTQVEACIEQTRDTFGDVDILFNNAGTAAGCGPFLAMSEQQWALSLAVNLTGMFHTTQLVLPQMIERGGGVIVNTSSLAGLGASELMCGYNTTKFGVVGFTKSIATEFGRFGIRCNCVCPGMVDTDMGAEEYEFISEMRSITIEEARRRAAEQIALRRQCPPEEVADVVAYLAGPGASYLTGVALPVAGGLAPGL